MPQPSRIISTTGFFDIGRGVAQRGEPVKGTCVMKLGVGLGEAVLPDSFEGGRELLADPLFSGEVKREGVDQCEVGGTSKSERCFLSKRGGERRVK